MKEFFYPPHFLSLLVSCIYMREGGLAIILSHKLTYLFLGGNLRETQKNKLNVAEQLEGVSTEDNEEFVWRMDFFIYVFFLYFIFFNNK